MCAALANVGTTTGNGTPSTHDQGGDYLVDQDAAEIMCKEAIDAVLDLEKMGLPFNRTPENGSTSAVSAAIRATTARPRSDAPVTRPTGPVA